MEKTSWEKLEGEQLNKLISRQMLSGDNATVARLLMKPGAVVPRHFACQRAILAHFVGRAEIRV